MEKAFTKGSGAVMVERKSFADKKGVHAFWGKKAVKVKSSGKKVRDRDGRWSGRAVPDGRAADTPK